MIENLLNIVSLSIDDQVGEILNLNIREKSSII